MLDFENVIYIWPFVSTARNSQADGQTNCTPRDSQRHVRYNTSYRAQMQEILRQMNTLIVFGEENHLRNVTTTKTAKQSIDQDLNAGRNYTVASITRWHRPKNCVVQDYGCSYSKKSIRTGSDKWVTGTHLMLFRTGCNYIITRQRQRWWGVEVVLN